VALTTPPAIASAAGVAPICLPRREPSHRGRWGPVRPLDRHRSPTEHRPPLPSAPGLILARPLARPLAPRSAPRPLARPLARRSAHRPPRSVRPPPSPLRGRGPRSAPRQWCSSGSVSSSPSRSPACFSGRCRVGCDLRPQPRQASGPFSGDETVPGPGELDSTLNAAHRMADQYSAKSRWSMPSWRESASNEGDAVPVLSESSGSEGMRTSTRRASIQPVLTAWTSR